MFLAGWEVNKGQTHIFSVSPPRTGRVWYLFLLTPYAYLSEVYRGVAAAIFSLDEMRSNLGRKGMVQYYQGYEGRRDYVVDFPANTCARSKIIHYESSLPFYGGSTPMVVLAYPMDWEDFPADPAPLVSTALPAQVLLNGANGGILGTASLALSALPDDFQAKPGSTIKLAYVISASTVGLTVAAQLNNQVRNQIAQSKFSFNRGEAQGLQGQDTMPALLPGEVATWEFSYQAVTCDLRNSVDSQGAYDQVMAGLGYALPPASSYSTTVRPTDALLVSLKDGIIEILGQDLGYKGIILASQGGGPVEGAAPARITFSDPVFIRLEFTRDIALCEEGKLVSENSTVYEYSHFPTPLRSFQAVTALARSLRVSTLQEGFPLPRFVTKKLKLTLG